MLIIDIDPSKSSSLVLSGSSLDLIRNIDALQNALVGAGHAPAFDASGWLPNVPDLSFSGSTTYTDLATQYLFDERGDVYDQLFGCTNSTWTPWTMFVVCQLTFLPAVETAILTISQAQPTSYPGPSAANIYPLVFFGCRPTHFFFDVWQDNLGTSNGVSIGAADLNAHILEASADGAGNIDTWFDGSAQSPIGDERPKTPGSLTLGATWYTTPRFVLEQLNGSVARVIVFDENISTGERLKVRNQLASLYGIPL